MAKFQHLTFKISHDKFWYSAQFDMVSKYVFKKKNK